MDGELKTAIEGLGKDVLNFKVSLERQLERHATAIRDLEECAAGTMNPGKSDAGKAHMRAFEAWLRNPTDRAKAAELAQFEPKTITGATPAAGGYAVPHELGKQIEQRLLKASPLRSIARVVQIGTDFANYSQLVTAQAAGSEWVGESDTRNQTASPRLGVPTAGGGILSSYVHATEEVVEDFAYDLAGWLVDNVARAHGAAEGLAFISGNGSKQPAGLFKNAPVATADFASPMRPIQRLQYLPVSASATSPTVPVITGDVLIDLVYSLHAEHRANGTWIMNSATLSYVRKLKTSDNQYLWAPSLAAGQPERLLGYPVVACEHMPDIALNAVPIAFGDFSAGYHVLDRGPFRITVDDNLTTPGKVKWYLRRRVGGMVVNDNAIKVLKMALS